jgi:hypothetical protein
MGKLFVTVFANPSYPLNSFLTVTNPDRAAAGLNNQCTGTNNWLGSTLYRETRIAQFTFNTAAKTRAIQHYV